MAVAGGTGSVCGRTLQTNRPVSACSPGSSLRAGTPSCSTTAAAKLPTRTSWGHAPGPPGRGTQVCASTCQCWANRPPVASRSRSSPPGQPHSRSPPAAGRGQARWSLPSKTQGIQGLRAVGTCASRSAPRTEDRRARRQRAVTRRVMGRTWQRRRRAAIVPGTRWGGTCVGPWVPLGRRLRRRSVRRAATLMIAPPPTWSRAALPAPRCGHAAGEPPPR